MNGDVNAPRPENIIDHSATIQIRLWKDCGHRMLHEEIPFLSLRCHSKLLRIHSHERPDCFFNYIPGRSGKVIYLKRRAYPARATPLIKYAITKTGKGGADDWIAYAITCKSEPKTVVCITKLR